MPSFDPPILDISGENARASLTLNPSNNWSLTLHWTSPDFPRFGTEKVVECDGWHIESCIHVEIDDFGKRLCLPRSPFNTEDSSCVVLPSQLMSVISLLIALNTTDLTPKKSVAEEINEFLREKGLKWEVTTGNVLQPKG